MGGNIKRTAPASKGNRSVKLKTEPVEKPKSLTDRTNRKSPVTETLVKTESFAPDIARGPWGEVSRHPSVPCSISAQRAFYLLVLALTPKCLRFDR